MRNGKTAIHNNREKQRFADFAFGFRISDFEINGAQRASLGVNPSGAVQCGGMSPDQQTFDGGSPQAESQNRSLLFYIVVVGAIALFIRFFIAAPYVVVGASMEPTFENYDYLIVDRLTYRLDGPKRGDVIVLDLPQNTSRALIKRVIGIPGDTIVLDGQKIRIVNDAHPDGFTLEEPYLDPANVGGASHIEVELGAEEYFVLGDNRRVSADSRLWGTLPREDIVGRVLLRLYPLDQIGILPGEYTFGI